MDNRIYEIKLNGETDWRLAIYIDDHIAIAHDDGMNWTYPALDRITEKREYDYFLPLSSQIRSRYIFVDVKTDELVTVTNMVRYKYRTSDRDYYPWELRPTTDLMNSLKYSCTQEDGYMETSDISMILSPIMGVPALNRYGSPEKGSVLVKRNIITLPNNMKNDGYYGVSAYDLIATGKYDKFPDEVYVYNDRNAVDQNGEMWYMTTSCSTTYISKNDLPLTMYFTTEETALTATKETPAGTPVKYNNEDCQIIAKHNGKILLSNGSRLDWIYRCDVDCLTITEPSRDVKMPRLSDNPITAMPTEINVGDEVEFMSSQDLQELYGLNVQGLPKTSVMFNSEMWDICDRKAHITSVNGKIITVDFGDEDHNERFGKFRLSIDFLTIAKQRVDTIRRNLRMKREEFIDKIKDEESLIIINCRGELYQCIRTKYDTWYYVNFQSKRGQYRYQDNDDLYEDVAENMVLAVFKGNLISSCPTLDNSTKIYISSDYITADDYIVKTNKVYKED
jgi:hypothetical protein